MLYSTCNCSNCMYVAILQYVHYYETITFWTFTSHQRTTLTEVSPHGARHQHSSLNTHLATYVHAITFTHQKSL